MVGVIGGVRTSLMGGYDDVLGTDRPCEKLFNTSWSAAAFLVRDSTAATTTVHRATDR